MRIPFEGIIAAKATPKGMPLLVSVWGNDFTFWARNPIIARQTRQALNRADALHSDCRRDIRLAVQSFGFDGRKAAKVLPGAGGIQAEVFHPGEPDTELRKQLGISTSAPVVINPRGPRGNVCNDVFFNAIPIILNECPKAVFLCSAMQGNTKAETSVNRLAIQGSVRLLPRVPREWMSNFFRLASVTVSPSLHDGTPNTLLEAMACGCFPIVGDIESVREWITDGINGLVCDATNPQSIAQTIIRALHDPQLRGRASEHNVRLISERAEYNKVMLEAEQFYHQVLGQAGSADGV
jgi:glycosyltransferase involved in cell wall biosynthesis